MADSKPPQMSTPTPSVGQRPPSAPPPPTAPVSETTPPINQWRRKSLRIVLLILVPFFAVLLSAHLYFSGGRVIESENAYVRAHVIQISPAVSGRVVSVSAINNTSVTKSTPLFQVDPQTYQLEVTKAQAELALTVSEIQSQRANYRHTHSALQTAFETQRFIQQQVETSTNQSRQQAVRKLKIAQQQVTTLRQQANNILVKLAGHADGPIDQVPAYKHNRARLALAQSQLQEATIHAPATGVVSNVRLQVGEYVKAGQAVFSLIETNSMWIEANLKETQLDNVRAGQSAEFKIDAYPGMQWQAEVVSIAPATGAEFSVLPAQNATGNWVKVVQRIPVKLKITPPPQASLKPLRAGMTATVRIHTNISRKPPAWLLALASNRTTPSLLQAALRKTLAIDRTTIETTATPITATNQATAFAAKEPPANEPGISQHQQHQATIPNYIRIEQKFATPPSIPSVVPESVLQIAPADIRLPPVDTSQSTSLQIIESNTASEKHLQPLPDELPQNNIEPTDHLTIHDSHWLLQQPSDFFTIQLGSTPNVDFLRKFSQRLANNLPNAIYHYTISTDEQAQYGLANGLFSTRQQANLALEQLPQSARQYNPWIRRIGDIQSAIQTRQPSGALALEQ